MSDYLSPGVYIEELPPQLRAIEGVSTSVAGFVGAAARGVVPGSPLPFTPVVTDPQVVTIVPTPAPVLVTSFSDFVNQFGKPLPLPDPTGTNYLVVRTRRMSPTNSGKTAGFSRFPCSHASESIH